MEELTKVTTYQEYKKAMDTELQRTTEGFVRIGYLLKVARDTDILRESGYSNVNEFAQKEYNIDKTQVSRFIHINDRFSENGYSDRLMEQYRNFGHAKLAIMLQLPDELNEVLTPDYSKSEIQAIKEELDEEKKISDLEVLMEGQDREQEVLDNNMFRVLHQLFKENPEKFAEVHGVLKDGLAAVLEVLAPSGNQMYSIRLQGIGRLMFSVDDSVQDAALVNLRTGEKEEYPWSDVLEMLKSMINTLCEAKSEWERIYGEPFPEKEKIAPVQPNSPTPAKSEEKPAQRKESKVVKSKPVEKKKDPEPIVESEPEEQIPGQMDVTDFKEVLPEEAETITEEEIEVVEEPGTRIPSLAETMSPEDKRKVIAGYKAAITSTLRNMPRMMAEGKWEKLGELAMDVKFRVDKIMELEGK